MREKLYGTSTSKDERLPQRTEKAYGNTAQFVGSVGDAFSAICCLQIFRFTSSKPSKSAIASDEKFIRLRTNSFVRYCPTFFAKGLMKTALWVYDRSA